MGCDWVKMLIFRISLDGCKLECSYFKKIMGCQRVKMLIFKISLDGCKLEFSYLKNHGMLAS